MPVEDTQHSSNFATSHDAVKHFLLLRKIHFISDRLRKTKLVGAAVMTVKSFTLQALHNPDFPASETLFHGT